MATIGELPYELLYYIILLLGQSPGGAADFARIVSVCRNFFLFAKDKRILKLVNFDKKMELKNFKRYQHINSLLVKCFEVGNVAAGFMLGKVILVRSSHLFLSGWQKAECDIHPCDFAKLSEIGCILATNVPALDCEVVSFMAYFLPKQVSTRRSMPFREDCWSEAAMATLVDAWGERYLELNRGNLWQKDWQAVADAVNSFFSKMKISQ